MALLTSFWQREHVEENNTSPSLEELSQFIEECLKANEFSKVGHTLWCQAKEGATDSWDIDNIRENIRAMLGYNNDNNNKVDDDPNKKLLESCENVNNSEESKEHKSRVQQHTHDVTEAEADKNANAHTNNLPNLQNAFITPSNSSTTIDTELPGSNSNNGNNIDQGDVNLSTSPLPESSPEPRSALAKLIAKAKKETSNINKKVNTTYHSELQKCNNKKNEVEEVQTNKRSRLELIARDGAINNQNNNNKDIERHITQVENNKYDYDEYEAEEFTVDLEQRHTQHDNLQDTNTNIDSGNIKNISNIADNEVHTTEDEQSANIKHPSQMTREEFLQQYKRAPRRGEIGQSAEMVAEAQKLGYVMSGSRNRGADRYVDRVQRQLHEREAAKLQQQFRRIEDARMDESMINSLVHIIEKTRQNVVK